MGPAGGAQGWEVPGSTPGGGPDVPPPPAPPRQPAGGPGGEPDGRVLGGLLVPVTVRSIPALLDDAFLLFRRAWRPTSIVVLLVLGSLGAVQGLLSGAVFGGDTSATGAALFDGSVPALSAGVVGLGLVVLLQVLVTPVLGGGVTWLLDELDRGVTHDWRDLLAATVRLSPRVLATSVLTFGVALSIVLVAGLLLGGPLWLLGRSSPDAAIGLAVVAAVPVLLVAGLVTLGLYVAVPVVVLEGARPVAALRRSWSLLRPQVWRVLALVVLGGIVLLLVQLGLITALAGLAEVSGPAGFALQALGGLVSDLLLVPLNVALALLVYVDARVRREGADVALLVEEVRRA